MTTAQELYQEGEQLKEEEKLEEAVAKLEAALSEDENHILSHMMLAVLCGRLGQHLKAVSHGERACELEPDTRAPKGRSIHLDSARAREPCATG